MTTYRRGDIVRVPIDFTDRTGQKTRPAVVVSSDEYNQNSPDLLVASVTGNLRAVSHPGDHTIARWQQAGLLKPSLVQTKIATVEPSLIIGKLGTLDEEDLEHLGKGLRQALAL